MARAADLTRNSLMKAATALFAEKGFDGASVREIVTRARANQAAINYHFGGKDGLYLEVLKSAIEAFTREESGAPNDGDLTREEALRRFIRQQLRPLLARDEIGRYLRIFAWETARPSEVLREAMASNATPFVARAVTLVRRFLPAEVSEQEAMCAAIWLMGQCNVFVRNREHFTQPPFELRIDEAFVDRLTDLVAGLALSGLTAGK